MEAQGLQQPATIARRRMLDWFIPASIKATPSADIDSHYDPYMTSQIILSVFAVSILSIVFTSFVYYVMADPAYQGYVLLSASISLVATIMGMSFTRLVDGSMNMMGNAYAFSTLVCLICVNLLGGFSWSSPNLPLVLFLPVWAFLMCDIRSGIIWSLISACFYLAVFVAGSLPLNIPMVFQADLLSQVHLASWMMAVGLVAFCVYAYQSSYRELSERLTRERSFFAYHADHDTLTGLANRNLFYRRAAKAIDFALEEQLKAAFIYIDLNDFKQINDNFGHQVGDEVLVNKAEKIKSVVRSSDTVARLGGDEFGIVLHAVNIETINRLMHILNKALDEPVVINGINHSVSASLGLSIAPDHGVIIDRLMQHADNAMYAEKRNHPFSTR